LLSRAIASLLYGTSPTDLATYGLVAATILATIIAAVHVPARRALAVGPMEALRSRCCVAPSLTGGDSHFLPNNPPSSPASPPSPPPVEGCAAPAFVPAPPPTNASRCEAMGAGR
jgi:hypothetical protein